MTGARECAKTRCGKLAVLGSRCVRHWLYRQWAYRKLPTHTLWWKKFEPGLVGGIAARVMLGEAAGPPSVVMPSSATAKWAPLVLNLIGAADAAWRKNEHPVRNEEAR